MPEEYYDDENYIVFPSCVVRVETDAAILVDLGEEGEHWFPKSVLHEDSEVFEKDTNGDLIVKKWIAEDRGLI